MSLQFADWNADGVQDLVTATFEGTAFVVPGGVKGFGQPEHILDAKGRHIVLSLYYDMEENEYKNADRSPEGQSNEKDHCVSAFAFDWDEDGDLDLLLGAKEGRLYLQRNEGSAEAPALTGINELLTAGGEPFMVPGGLTAARPVDWDGDGRLDLVCGGFEGGVWVFRNVGKKGQPSFARPEELLAPKAPEDHEGLYPVKGVYVDPTDMDGDGDLDLLIGGYAMTKPVARKLSAAEQEELTSLRAEHEKLMERRTTVSTAIREKMEGLPEEEQGEFFQKAWTTGEMAEINDRFSVINRRLEVLAPTPKRRAAIWWVEQKAGQ